jgi:choline dehydrogenase-like flavoprotein
MGTSEHESVTDAWGEVRGCRPLFVADASIMPTALDRHPTWTLLSLSLRVADGIARRARLGEL